MRNDEQVDYYEWTKERFDELDTLIDMLNTLSGLNNGGLFIEKVQKCIEIAETMTGVKWSDGGRESLTFWLRGAAIEQSKSKRKESAPNADD
jgi:hypothetical protein